MGCVVVLTMHGNRGGVIDRAGCLALQVQAAGSAPPAWPPCALAVLFLLLLLQFVARHQLLLSLNTSSKSDGRPRRRDGSFDFERRHPQLHPRDCLRSWVHKQLGVAAAAPTSNPVLAPCRARRRLHRPPRLLCPWRGGGRRQRSRIHLVARRPRHCCSSCVAVAAPASSLSTQTASTAPPVLLAFLLLPLFYLLL
jgi:hypothetical protein